MMKLKKIKLTFKEFKSISYIASRLEGYESISESFRGEGYALNIKNKATLVKSLKKAISEDSGRVLKHKRDRWEIVLAEGLNGVLFKLIGMKMYNTKQGRNK